MKLMTIALGLLCLLLIVPVGGSSQYARPAPKCPQLVIACPLETVEQDTQLRFSALVAGDDPNAALSFSWTISNGRISEGQGTPSIIVDTTGMGGRRITAKVVVGGLGRDCQSTVSCAILVMNSNSAPIKPAESVTRPTAPATKPAERAASPPQPVSRTSEAVVVKPAEVVRKPADAPRIDNTNNTGNTTARRFAGYGDVTFELEKEHLTGLARELRRAPDAQGYIIVYGGRCSEESAALERAERAKDWLINRHDIDASRIVVIDGGYRETLSTEIFVAPVDATLPELKGSVQPLDDAGCK
ncbi:MAG TPA: hypothetical protein VM911_16240 [Pyrinomonadaceae bacterium]|nr:hypothetical protein [Pyrinomonadaceae bacterium]